MDKLAVVVGQGEIDGINALAILFAGTAGVRTANGMAGLHAKGLFDGDHKRAKQIQENAIGLANQLDAVGADQRAEDKRRLASFERATIDATRNCVGFFGAVDEGQANCFKLDLLKLRKDRMAERFSSNAGAVRNDEYGAFYFWGCHEVVGVHRRPEAVQSRKINSRLILQQGWFAYCTLPPGLTVPYANTLSFII